MNTWKNDAAADMEMLRKLQANKDKDAFVAIFDCYSHEVYALAAIEIRERMPSLIAEDAAQQILISVFASLYVNCDEIEPDTSLSLFLRASTTRAIDQYVLAQQARISTL